VPIRDLETVLEALGDQPGDDAAALIEHTRLALRRTICQQYRDERRCLHAVVLHGDVEAEFLDQLEAAAVAPQSRRRPLDGNQVRPIVEALFRLIHAGQPPVVVCCGALRAPLRRALAAGLPQVVVLSRNELTIDTELRAVISVGRPAEAVA
jgi:flagellar biosynthesis protein FlhA